MEISLVPPELIEGLWPRIFPHLAKAAEYTFGRYEPEDIFATVVNGQAHLWVAITDTGDIAGITITRFWHYPRKNCLDVIFLSGNDWASWKDAMFDTLTNWAQDSGCDAIEASARPGFARVVKDRGYTPLWQVFEVPVYKDVGAVDG